MNPDGAVEFTAPEKDEKTGKREYRTYRASSIEEFKKKYPEVAQKYDLEHLVSVREVPDGDEQLREWLGLKEPSEGGEESEGRRFGILLSPVGPALASHLGLREGQGLLVQQVERGSLAEKAGVKPFDVIVTLNGEKTHAQKIEEFRSSMQKALGTSTFTLDVIRNGKHETIHVNPSPEKEQKKEKVK
jgi:predicted metalloprotease with PDZ domain